MKNTFPLLVLLQLIFSCSNKENFKNEFYSVNLIDTFYNELKLDTADYIKTASFHPMYIGEKSDSIILAYSTREVNHRTFDWGTSLNRAVESSDISVFIDTSKIIGSVNKYIFRPPPPFGGNPNIKTASVNHRGEIKSYAVFIKNISTDTLTIGFGEHLPLLIEAKDSSGNWKKIQHPYYYGCGTGVPFFYLPPENILITSCKLFAGDYQTKMRLVYGFDEIVYSNEFVGWMDKGQFEKI